VAGGLPGPERGTPPTAEAGPLTDGAPGAPGPDPARPGGLGFAPIDILLLVALGGLWGSAYIFIREGIVLGASPIVFAGVRYLLSAAGFAALAVARRERLPARGPLAVSAVVGGLLVVGLYGGFLYWGEQFTTGGYASVLASTAPILTLLFAYPILPAERVGPRALGGLLLGLLGVVVLVLPEITGSPIGVWPGPLYIIAAFLSTALGTVLLRRYGGGPQSLTQLAAQFAVGGVLLTCAAALLPVPEALPTTPGVLGALIALVVLSSLGGYFVYFTLHHRVGPTRANVVAYLLPLVAVAIGTGLFGEQVTLLEFAGFAIVLVGLTLILRAPRAPAGAAPAAR
jgi:probable blue pigment (indigoidine) exporter